MPRFALFRRVAATLCPVLPSAATQEASCRKAISGRFNFYPHPPGSTPPMRPTIATLARAMRVGALSGARVPKHNMTVCNCMTLHPSQGCFVDVLPLQDASCVAAGGKTVQSVAATWRNRANRGKTEPCFAPFRQTTMFCLVLPKLAGDVCSDGVRATRVAKRVARRRGIGAASGRFLTFLVERFSSNQAVSDNPSRQPQ